MYCALFFLGTSKYVTNMWTWDYVKRELPNIRHSVPAVLIQANSIDQSHHRAIIKDQVTVSIDKTMEEKGSVQIVSLQLNLHSTPTMLDSSVTQSEQYGFFGKAFFRCDILPKNWGLTNFVKIKMILSILKTSFGILKDISF